MIERQLLSTGQTDGRTHDRYTDLAPHTMRSASISHFEYCVLCLHGFRSPSATPTPAPLVSKKGKGRPYSITEHRVPELIPVLGSQPAGGVSHKPGGRLPLLSARPAVTLATLKRAATSFAAW